MNESMRKVETALRHLTQDGWPASTRDICKATGIASTATVHYALVRLLGLGLVERGPRGRGYRTRRTT